MNPSDSPLIIAGTTATTPCCSSIGPLPGSVPPHGRIKVPVRYKPGQRTGPGRVGFEIHVGPQGEDEIHLSVTASLISEFEAEAVGEVKDHLGVNQAASRVLRVICRRQGDQGLKPLTSVRASGGMEARLVGHRAGELKGGIAESRHEVEVKIPASAAIGRHEEQVVLLWDGGIERVHPIAWEVDPPLRMTPTALITRAGGVKTNKDLTIRSDGSAFAVLAVTGPVVASFTDDIKGQANVHHIRVGIDATRPVAASSRIEIVTDHPDQPKLTLSVLILPENPVRGDER